jgi:hypothetical protein
MYRWRCKRGGGYIICDWLGQSIHGGYPCTGGDVRGEGDSLSVIG